MEQCMKMPGGGFFKVGPGQVSDDSELALCLMQGIINSNLKVVELNSTAISNFGPEEMAEEISRNAPKIRVSKNKIALMYKKWVDSRPFDMGNTTRSTIGTLATMKAEDPDLAKNVHAIASEKCKSESNGSLMRATPMAVWASNIQDIDKLQKLVSMDVLFTHANETVHQSVLIYSATIGYLLRNFQVPTRAADALKFAKTLAEDRRSKQCLEWLEISESLAAKVSIEEL